jgi:hypothetical protein
MEDEEGEDENADVVVKLLACAESCLRGEVIALLLLVFSTTVGVDGPDEIAPDNDASEFFEGNGVGGWEGLFR